MHSYRPVGSSGNTALDCLLYPPETAARREIFGVNAVRGKLKRNISAEVRVVPLYLGLMVTPLIVGEHSLFPRLQF